MRSNSLILSQTAVFGSWNGATEVSSWRVLAGADPASMTAQGFVVADSFESSVILPQRYGYVAVQAVGARGRLLDTSATVKVKPPA